MFDKSSINVFLNWGDRYYLFLSWREQHIRQK